MRLPSGEALHADICNRAVDRMMEYDKENRVLRRALELACLQFLGDDDIAVQGFLRQAEAELKEANHEQD